MVGQVETREAKKEQQTELTRSKKLYTELRRVKGRLQEVEKQIQEGGREESKGSNLNLSFGKVGSGGKRPVINKSMIKSIVRESTTVSGRSASSNTRSSVQSAERGTGSSPYANMMQSPTQVQGPGTGAFQAPRKMISIQRFQMGDQARDLTLASSDLSLNFNVAGVNQSMFQPRADSSMANMEEKLNRSADLAQMEEYKRQLKEFEEKLAKSEEMKSKESERLKRENNVKLKKMYDTYQESLKKKMAKIKLQQEEKAKLNKQMDILQEEIKGVKDINNNLKGELLDVKKEMEKMLQRHEWVTTKFEWMQKVEEKNKKVMEENEKVHLDFKEYKTKYQIAELQLKKVHNTMQEMKGNIRVYCRVRPMTQKDEARKETSIVSIIDDCTVRVKLDSGAKDYIFDRCFDQLSSQGDIFQEIKSLSQSALDGFNVCVFAYGQTGAGKTYTLQGIHTQVKNHQGWGLVPRSIHYFFSLVREREQQLWKGVDSIYEIKVECYMVELYKNFLYDLLLPPSYSKRKQKLDIIEDVSGCTYINGATVIVKHYIQIYEVDDAASAFDLYTRGISTRQTGTHDMNYESSRSHLVYSLIIRVFNKKTEQRTVSKLSFVDLAGSEKFSKINASNERIRESKIRLTVVREINKSLSSLNRVFSALKDRLGKKEIPYRDNKLTYLMKDSIGGNSKTLMFVNVSPAASNGVESSTSLIYGRMVKEIKNEPKKNFESKDMEKMKMKLRELESQKRRMIEAMRRANLDFSEFQDNDSIFLESPSVSLYSHKKPKTNVSSSRTSATPRRYKE